MAGTPRRQVAMHRAATILLLLCLVGNLFSAASVQAAPTQTMSTQSSGQSPLERSLAARSLAAGKPLAYHLDRNSATAKQQSPIRPTTPVEMMTPTPLVSMLGTWDAPDRVLLRWLPQGEWIPEAGFSLYRTVKGQTTLLAEGLGRTDNLTLSDADKERLTRQFALNGRLLRTPPPQDDNTQSPALSVSEDGWTEGPLVSDLDDLSTLVGELRGRTQFTPAVRQTLLAKGLIASQDTTEAIEKKIYNQINEVPKLHKDEIISGADRFNQYFINSIQRTTAGPIMPITLNGAQPAVLKNTDIPLNGATSPSLKPTIGAAIIQPADGIIQIDPVKELLQARQDIISLSNVSFELALAAGLAFVDQVDPGVVSKGETIRYTLAPSGETKSRQSLLGGGRASVTIRFGIEERAAAPKTMQGYALDQRSYLRWDLPKDDYSRKVLAGYVVERRTGDGDFQALNPHSPAVISYSADEEGNLYEQAAFFTDDGTRRGNTFANGERLWYRVYGIDLFGRRTEASAAMDVDVIKTLPPPAPSVQQPVLADSLVKKPTIPGRPMGVNPRAGVDSILQTTPAQHGSGESPLSVGSIGELPINLIDEQDFMARRMTVMESQIRLSERMKQIKDRHPSQTGIFVAFSHSLEEVTSRQDQARPLPPRLAKDLVDYRIYRSEAEGAGSFASAQLVKVVSLQDPDLYVPKTNLSDEVLFYDTAIQPGRFYAYWVTARDSWGNESSCSQPRIIGYPTLTPPGAPQGVSATFKVNDAIKNRPAIPGFGERFLRSESSSVTPSSAQAIQKSGASLAGTTGSPTQTQQGKPSIAQAALQGQDYILPLTQFQPDRIHALVVVGANEIRPDGSVTVSWYPDANAETIAYSVYRCWDSDADPKSVDRDRVIAEANRLLYTKVATGIQETQVRDTPTPRPQQGTLYYLILKDLQPEGSDNEAGLPNLAPGGHVTVTWTTNPDPQVAGYRVYRTEIPRDTAELLEANPSAAPANWESQLVWNLVADGLKGSSYTETVPQSLVHFYRYRVATVTVWGVETAKAAATSTVRIPTTVPPAMPHMLTPITGPGQVMLRWKPVPEATRYLVYRTRMPIPRLEVGDIAQAMLEAGIKGALANTTASQSTAFQSGDLTQTLVNMGVAKGLASSQTAESSKPNTGDIVQALTDAGILGSTRAQGNAASISAGEVIDALTQSGIVPRTAAGTEASEMGSQKSIIQTIDNLTVGDQLKLYQTIRAKYGPLALAPYGALDPATAIDVEWLPRQTIDISYLDNQKKIADNDIFTWLDDLAAYPSTYLYTVQAEIVRDELKSERPAPLSATPLKDKGPAAPVVSARPTDLGPALTWAKYSNDDAVGYIVFRSPEENGDYEQVSPLLTVNMWLDISVPVGRSYWYKVVIIDEAGLLSASSAPVAGTRKGVARIPNLGSLTPQSATLPAPEKRVLTSSAGLSITPPVTVQPPIIVRPVKPPAPTGLQVQTVTSTSLRLAWNASTGATGYRVYRAKSDPGRTLSSMQLVGNVTTPGFQVAGLEASSKYWFAVTAVNGSLESDPSTVITATTSAVIVQRPVLQSTLRVVSSTETSITVAWDAVSPAPMEYRVYGAVAGEGAMLPLLKVLGITTGTQLEISGLNPATTYTLQVKALRREGEAAVTASTKATTKAPQIPATMTLNGYTLQKLTYKKYADGVLNCSAELLLPRMTAPVPVLVNIEQYRGSVVTRGEVSLAAASNQAVGSSTLHLTALDLSTTRSGVFLSGQMVVPHLDTAGVRAGLAFSKAELRADGTLTADPIPWLQSGPYRLNEIGELILDLEPAHPGLVMKNGKMETALGQLMLNDDRFTFTFAEARLDDQGRLAADFHAQAWTSALLAIPVGMELQIASATLSLDNGQVNAQKSRLDATLLLPFGKGEAPVTLAGADFTKTPLGGQILGSLVNPVSQPASTKVSLAQFPRTQVNLKALTTMSAEQVRANPTLVAPVERQALASSLGYALTRAKVINKKPSLAPVDPQNRGTIHLTIPTWDGAGILPAASDTGSLAPILLEELDAGISSDGDSAAPRPVIELQATKLTVIMPARKPQAEPDWIGHNAPDYVGFGIEQGNGFLPSDYIRPKDAKHKTKFALDIQDAMVSYDRVGLRGRADNEASSAESVAVLLNDVVDAVVTKAGVDMARNQALVNVDGRISVAALNRDLSFHAFTDPETECLIFGILKEKDPAVVQVTGGQLIGTNLHLDGSSLIQRQELTAQIDWLDLILAAPITQGAQNPAAGLDYGLAKAAKPARASFQGFAMEVRRIRITDSGDLRLLGAVKLADDIPLNTLDSDDITLQKAILVPNPLISSSASLDYHYQELVRIKASLLFAGTEYRDQGDGNFWFTIGSEDPLGGITGKAQVRIGATGHSYWVMKFGLPQPTPMGPLELDTSFTGMAGYNVALPRGAEGEFDIPEGWSDGSFLSWAKELNGQTFFVAETPINLKVKGETLFGLNPVRMVIEPGPAMTMDAAVIWGGKAIAFGQIGYYHPEHRFSAVLTVPEMSLPLLSQYSVSGSISFGVGPNYWMVALGYPETATVTMPISGLPCTFGAGFSYEFDKGSSTLKMKALAALDTGDVTLGIVYVRAYISAEGELVMELPSDFLMTVHIQGGAEGGVKLKGRKFRVIRMGLDLLGEAQGDGGSIRLSGHAKVYWSVDLWLIEASGSVNWYMNYRL